MFAISSASLKHNMEKTKGLLTINDNAAKYFSFFENNCSSIAELNGSNEVAYN